MGRFGNEAQFGGNATNIKDDIVGGLYTMNSSNCQADSITAYINTNDITGPKFIGIIYESGSGDLIGYTDIYTLNEGPNGDNRSITANFSSPKPSLVSGTMYYLCAWMSGTTGNTLGLNIGEGALNSYSLPYDWTENSGVPSGNYNNRAEDSSLVEPQIYCTYSLKPDTIPYGIKNEGTGTLGFLGNGKITVL